MATVVSCPECQRKLKVAPTSIGKSVKCPCGNIFKAREAHEALTTKTSTPAASTTFVVACDNCQAKLKVPASARGRKMKCSKCSATFVVPAAEAPAALPDWSTPAPPAKSKPTPPAYDEDEPAVAAKPAKKSSPARPQFFEDGENDDAAPVRKSASSPPYIAEDEPVADREPPARAKGKPHARVASAGKPISQTPAHASGCGGCVLSIFVLFIVIAYIAVFVPLYFFRPEIAEHVDLPFEKPPPESGKHRPAPRPEEDGDKKDNALDNEKAKPFDNGKQDKEFNNDREKKDNGVDKERKDKLFEKDANDNDENDPANPNEGAALREVPAPTITISPALDAGRPAKPVTRTRTIRRVLAD